MYFMIIYNNSNKIIMVNYALMVIFRLDLLNVNLLIINVFLLINEIKKFRDIFLTLYKFKYFINLIKKTIIFINNS